MIESKIVYLCQCKGTNGKSVASISLITFDLLPLWNSFFSKVFKFFFIWWIVYLYNFSKLTNFILRSSSFTASINWAVFPSIISSISLVDSRIRWAVIGWKSWGPEIFVYEGKYEENEETAFTYNWFRRTPPSSYLTSTVKIIKIVFDDKMFIIDILRHVLVFRVIHLRMINHPLEIKINKSFCIT